MSDFNYTKEQVAELFEELELAASDDRAIASEYDSIIDDLYELFLDENHKLSGIKDEEEDLVFKAIVAASEATNEERPMNAPDVDFNGLNDFIDYEAVTWCKD